jgi:hypothetical protein
MTHWNIVKPEDGDAPGRCCCMDVDVNVDVSMGVNMEHSQPRGSRSSSSPPNKCAPDMNSRFACPSCRYTTLLELVLQEIQEEDPHELEIAAAGQALAANPTKTTTTKTTTTQPQSTRAKAIHASTRYSIAKWLHHTRQQRQQHVLRRRPITLSPGRNVSANCRIIIIIKSSLCLSRYVSSADRYTPISTQTHYTS